MNAQNETRSTQASAAVETIGRPYSMNGIQWTIKRRQHNAIYPYAHTVVTFTAEPTEAGRRMDAYKAERCRLGDEWVADITNSESLIDHLTAAGKTSRQITDLLDDAHNVRMASYAN